MAEMKEIPPGSYDLKLGETFGKNPSQVAYQTLRYDFKPKSVSAESETYIAFGDNSDVTIAVPAETGDNLTVYRGGQKAVKAEKECILFFDHGTGELRLEQIASNVTVKKTRGDDDNDGLLRTEIQRLRSKARVESDSSEVDHKSSSGSSDSEDDDDDEDAAKASTMSSDDASSGSESGDDDDFQDIMEQHLKQSDGPSTAPAPEPTISHKSFAPVKKPNLAADLLLSESSDDDD